MKKNKGARIQKSQRNEAEKILRALDGSMPQAGLGRRSVLRHGNTITFEKAP